MVAGVNREGLLAHLTLSDETLLSQEPFLAMDSITENSDMQSHKMTKKVLSASNILSCYMLSQLPDKSTVVATKWFEHQ